jgi:hypothetical protein
MQTLAAHAGERDRTPEHAPRNRTEAEDRRDRGEHDQPEARGCSLDHRVPDAVSLRSFGLDLLDEDDRVAGDHTHQRKDAGIGPLDRLIIQNPTWLNRIRASMEFSTQWVNRRV